jgi:hypothetical protein
MNTALEYSTRVVQEGGRRCKKSTLNDLVHLTPLRIPLMNPPVVLVHCTVMYKCKKLPLSEQLQEQDICSIRVYLYASVFSVTKKR